MKKRYDIYVDGSFSKSKPNETFGAVIILVDGTPIMSQRFRILDPSMVKMRNVGGELIAAAMSQVIIRNIIDKSNKEIPDVCLYYDYEGIKQFAVSGGWKAEKEGAKKYQTLMLGMKHVAPIFRLYFIKVQAHTGVKWNEAVDALANGIVQDELKSTYGGCTDIEVF